MFRLVVFWFLPLFCPHAAVVFLFVCPPVSAIRPYVSALFGFVFWCHAILGSLGLEHLRPFLDACGQAFGSFLFFLFVFVFRVCRTHRAVKTPPRVALGCLDTFMPSTLVFARGVVSGHCRVGMAVAFGASASLSIPPSHSLSIYIYICSHRAYNPSWWAHFAPFGHVQLFSQEHCEVVGPEERCQAVAP